MARHTYRFIFRKPLVLKEKTETVLSRRFWVYCPGRYFNTEPELPGGTENGSYSRALRQNQKRLKLSNFQAGLKADGTPGVSGGFQQDTPGNSIPRKPNKMTDFIWVRGNLENLNSPALVRGNKELELLGPQAAARWDQTLGILGTLVRNPKRIILSGVPDGTQVLEGRKTTELQAKIRWKCS